MRRGAAWHPARVDNVNEDDGTFDLICDDGDEEDGVAAHLIRPRPHAGTATKAVTKAVTTTAANPPNAAKAAATESASKAATKATASSAAPAVASQAVQAAGGKRKGGAVAAEEAPPPRLVPTQHDKKQASLRGFFAKRTGA